MSKLIDGKLYHTKIVKRHVLRSGRENEALSELIVKLRALKDEYGDAFVYVEHNEDETGTYSELVMHRLEEETEAEKSRRLALIEESKKSRRELFLKLKAEFEPNE